MRVFSKIVGIVSGSDPTNEESLLPEAIGLILWMMIGVMLIYDVCT